MSALPTPKIVDLDDPLTPRPEAATPAAPAANSRPRRSAVKTASTGAATATVASPPATRSLADEELVAIFARVPKSIADRLSETTTSLNAARSRRSRISQQELLGALIDQHVTPKNIAALEKRVDAYRARIRA